MQVASGTRDRDRHPGSGRAADLFGHAAYLRKAWSAAMLPRGACCSLVAHACARHALLISGARSALRGRPLTMLSLAKLFLSGSSPTLAACMSYALACSTTAGITSSLPSIT